MGHVHDIGAKAGYKTVPILFTTIKVKWVWKEKNKMIQIIKLGMIVFPKI